MSGEQRQDPAAAPAPKQAVEVAAPTRVPRRHLEPTQRTSMRKQAARLSTRLPLLFAVAVGVILIATLIDARSMGEDQANLEDTRATVHALDMELRSTRLSEWDDGGRFLRFRTLNAYAKAEKARLARVARRQPWVKLGLIPLIVWLLGLPSSFVGLHRGYGWRRLAVALTSTAVSLLWLTWSLSLAERSEDFGSVAPLAVAPLALLWALTMPQSVRRPGAFARGRTAPAQFLWTAATAYAFCLLATVLIHGAVPTHARVTPEGLSMQSALRGLMHAAPIALSALGLFLYVLGGERRERLQSDVVDAFV